MSEMSNESAQIAIVTDGITDLVAQVRGEPNVTIVPCPVRIGKQATTTELLRSERPTTKGKLQILPPPYTEFLRAYQKLASFQVISIHLPHTLHEVSHQARLARNLLLPRGNTTVFDARTTDMGVGFLVRVASETAQDQKGYNVGQILLVLHRLQSQFIHSFLLTKDIGPFTDRLPLTRGQRFRSKFPGRQFLLAFDPQSIYFRLLKESSDLSRNLAQWAQFLENIQEPCHIRMRHQGFDKEMPTLRDQLTRMFQPVSISVSPAWISGFPYPKEYVEIICYPSDQEIENIKAFVRRVSKAYGISSTATPFTV
jgi:hypothetical protein